VYFLFLFLHKISVHFFSFSFSFSSPRGKIAKKWQSIEYGVQGTDRFPSLASMMWFSIVALHVCHISPHVHRQRHRLLQCLFFFFFFFSPSCFEPWPCLRAAIIPVWFYANIRRSTPLLAMQVRPKKEKKKGQRQTK